MGGEKGSSCGNELVGAAAVVIMLSRTLAWFGDFPVPELCSDAIVFVSTCLL